MPPVAARRMASPFRSPRGAGRRRTPGGLEVWFARLTAAQQAVAAAPVDDVLAVACARITELLDADAVIVATRSGCDVVARAVEGIDTVPIGQGIPLEGTMMGLAIRTGRPQLCVDGNRDARSDRAINEAAGVRSSIVVPLLQDGIPVGAVLAGSSRPGAFDETDLALLDLVATATAGRLALALAVSEHAGMRDALAAHSRLVRTMLDSLDEGVVLQRAPDGAISLANAAAERLLGVPPGALRDRSTKHLRWPTVRDDGTPMPPYDHPGLVALRTGKPQRDQIVGLVLPDGTTRWLSVTALPVVDPTDPVAATVVTTFADVTGERTATTALAESDRRLAAAQELTGLAWWEYDLGTDENLWSDQMWRLLGEEPGGRPPGRAGTAAYLHPDDRDRFLAGSAGTPSEDDTHLEVFRVVHPDGSVHVLQAWSQQRLGPDGCVASIFGATLDVTEREEAARAAAAREQQFRVAFDGAPIGMTMLDMAPGREGRVLRANDAYLAMIGYDADAIRGMSMIDWTHPEDVEQDLARVRRLYRGEARSLSYEKRYRHRDGGTVHAWVSSAVATDAAGTPLHLISHILDVTQREEASRALHESERRLAQAHRLTGLAWWEWDIRTGELHWSEGMYRIVRRDPGIPMTMQDWQALLHPDDRAEAGVFDHAATEGGQGRRHVFRVVLDDGSVRHLEAWTSPVRDEHGAVVALHGATLDVTSREAAAGAVQRSEQQFRIAFDNAPIGMTLVSLAPGEEGRMVRANDAFCTMLGRDEERLLAEGAEVWTHPDDFPMNRYQFGRITRGEETELAFHNRFLHADGHVVHCWARCTVTPDETGRPLYLISHTFDVTDQLAQQQELERLALTDTLTGLANRTLFDARVVHGLAALRRDGDRLALLLLDIDRFKLVNDSLGHQVGDALLVEVAQRLQSVIPPDMIVARLGGDEFVVLVERADDEAVTSIAQRILDALRAPYALPSGDTVVTTTSLGIATATEPAHTADELFREADMALYRAKDGGRDRIAVFDAELRSRAVGRVDTEHRLRRALAEGGLRLHLQPVVRMSDGTTALAEALVRLEDPELGLIPPLEFIEVAEDSGLIADVDGWVMERSIELLADPDCALPAIGINISGRTLEQPGLLRRLRESLDRWQVAGDRLVVEITESILLDGTAVVSETITALHELGIRVGIDDFGTGYSALAYLQRFDLDFLKIDRSFVAQLGEGPQREAVVAAIIDLAHAHELTVTAEGVETAEQADALRRMGCDHGQGWLFGRPAPAAGASGAGAAATERA